MARRGRVRAAVDRRRDRPDHPYRDVRHRAVVVAGDPDRERSQNHPAEIPVRARRLASGRRGRGQVRRAESRSLARLLSTSARYFLPFTMIGIASREGPPTITRSPSLISF